MNYKEAYNYGKMQLEDGKIAEASLDARLLLEHVCHTSRNDLLVRPLRELTLEEQSQFEADIDIRKNHVPLQHITGVQEFMGLEFVVNENVLIPRPDTEILVEEVIKIAQKYNSPRILDLCTGSGAIAISLKKFVPNADITAVDISEKALEIAQKNAEKLEAKINFVKSNLFDKLDNKKFDIIVSNPPYIRKDEIKKLSEEVQKEPKIALDGGEDGLDFYRIIAEQAINYLKTGSFLCFEIGYNQKNDVIKIIEDEQNYKNTYCKKDLYGNDRIIITQVL